MPCLNEADTLATCIARRSRRWRSTASTARSSSPTTAAPTARRTSPLARARGWSPSTERGYGSALMGGIAAARGRYVLMGDADDSYDFLELPKFVDKLREGYDLVQGCRLPAGRRQGAAGRDAVPAPLVGQPDVLVDGALVVPARRSTTSTAACAASPRRTTSGSTSAARGWSSPPR